jgi:DNA-binding NtrC family response regulator
VRELRNVLERAAAIAPGEVLDETVIAKAMPRRKPRLLGSASEAELDDLAHARARAEREAILDALRRADGSRTRAAQLLGVSRSQFYEKLKRYDLSN